MSTTDTAVDAAITFALGEMNAPATDVRRHILRKYLRVVDGKVHVVDVKTGEVRYKGRNPMTIRELVTEVLYWKTPESRLLRWKPYGRPV